MLKMLSNANGPTNKIALAAIALALAVGCGVLFAQQPPPGPVPSPRYSAEPFVVGVKLGVSITDHATERSYIYYTDPGNGLLLDMAGEIDLTKAGQAKIDWTPSTRPASGG
jgi:hypothetical protein